MIIKGGTIVNEGRVFRGDIVIEGGVIVDIVNDDTLQITDERLRITDDGLQPSTQEIVNAEGCYVLPGVIDSRWNNQLL